MRWYVNLGQKCEGYMRIGKKLTWLKRSFTKRF